MRKNGLIQSFSKLSLLIILTMILASCLPSGEGLLIGSAGEGQQPTPTQFLLPDAPDQLAGDANTDSEPLQDATAGAEENIAGPENIEPGDVENIAPPENPEQPVEENIALPEKVAKGAGAIWTTNGGCGDETQDVNHFQAGDHVYINGDGFGAGSYYWYIKGQPGGASADPGIKVAEGTYTVGSSGAFCFHA